MTLEVEGILVLSSVQDFGDLFISNSLHFDGQVFYRYKKLNLLTPVT